MKTLTIITTTYNRAYCINRLYDSLISQDNDDFIWLIIDDGSTDNTRDLVNGYISEGLIEIEYHYKTNGGMHTARNMGYRLARTEINVIIDSDDWMADGAVETIVDYWKKNRGVGAAGMVSLNADPDGKIIGSDLPKGVLFCSYRDLYKKYKITGDKKLIYRSDLTAKYPFPEYEDEKFYPASYKYYKIDKEINRILVLDSVTCIVNYSDNSMTRNKYEQYRNSPRSFMHYRKEMMCNKLGIKEDIRNMIHYIMEMKMCGEKADLEVRKNPLYYPMYFLGSVFAYYINHTSKKY